MLLVLTSFSRSLHFCKWRDEWILYSIQWGFKPRLNKVKVSGRCHRFSEGIYRAKLDKIWSQIRQGT
ncbi:hypothetical protein [Siminovitchia terrae]|uniref:Uncharacterized protein n=1 Tax=Siminovitchia terrae TaxID=1914933 RepID=A0A429X732_SIMTE|nr:hypothetical protein [Siminovitchia terrae]RST59237.1 hypothetical protein D5F11_012830 [Siminovitchia terrae]